MRRTLSTTSDKQHEHFYRHTNGRWFWDEEKQLCERYGKFEVSEIQEIAAKSVSAKACSCMIRLSEGGFNKVFRFSMDKGSIVIAHIPNPNPEPPHMTVSLKVATMEFVCGYTLHYIQVTMLTIHAQTRSIFNVPTPRVIAWIGGI
jgi:hypothetical protein